MAFDRLMECAWYNILKCFYLYSFFLCNFLTILWMFVAAELTLPWCQKCIITGPKPPGRADHDGSHSEGSGCQQKPGHEFEHYGKRQAGITEDFTGYSDQPFCGWIPCYEVSMNGRILYLNKLLIRFSSSFSVTLTFESLDFLLYCLWNG